jgi:hypothetical protein
MRYGLWRTVFYLWRTICLLGGIACFMAFWVSMTAFDPVVCPGPETFPFRAQDAFPLLAGAFVVIGVGEWIDKKMRELNRRMKFQAGQQ